MPIALLLSHIKKERKNMNKLNGKKTSCLAALILLLMISTTLAAFPITTAQTTIKYTYAYIGAIPNPVGVNEEVLLHVGITDPLPAVTLGWENLSITITRPDGETEVIDGIRTDSTGGTGVLYTPTLVGTYTLQSHFPEQEFGGVLYLSSDSDIIELTVQEKSLPSYPGNSLPSEYWTRPIDDQLHEWSTVSGSWLRTPANLVAPYNDGPESPHILWAKSLNAGGLVGGELGPASYESGDAYEGYFSSSVILNGILYYNRFKSGYPTQEVVAVDLHTGKELWSRVLSPGESLLFGQNLFWDS